MGSTRNRCPGHNENAGLRVGVLGHGAIGTVVARALADGQIPGVVLAGVVSHQAPATPDIPQCTLAEALERCDLIVEAAGQQAVRDHAEQILRAGVDLLIVSIGALVDEELRDRLDACGSGRLFYTAGAIGGLDLVAASRRLGPFSLVQLTTTKLPSTLVQPWMDAETVERLRTTTTAFDVYRGTARDVPAKFPKSTNVAAGLAVACGSWSDVQVIVRADPQARMTTHVIDVANPYGEYHFEIRNAPDETNPATSKIVPHAALRTIATIAGVGGQIV